MRYLLSRFLLVNWCVNPIPAPLRDKLKKRALVVSSFSRKPLVCATYLMITHTKLLPHDDERCMLVEESSKPTLSHCTLEWHGEHLPLGADGLQSQGLFVELARKCGGIVLPILFLCADGKEEHTLQYMQLCRRPQPPTVG